VYKRHANFPAMFRYLATLCDELRAFGVFNMLLSDGEYVMSYCSNNLHWLTRCAPFGEASLLDEEVVIDFQSETTPNDVVTLITTRPLTGNENWVKMAPGEFNLFRMGERVATNQVALEQDKKIPG